jgi:hypothetical protein
MNAPKEFAQYLDAPINTFNELLNDERYKKVKPYNNWVVFRDFLVQTRDAILVNRSINETKDMGEEVAIFFEELDNRRNTNFLKTFPQFSEWIT